MCAVLLLLSLFTMISYTSADWYTTVTDYNDFKEKSNGAAKVVLLFSCDDNGVCAQVQGQIELKSQKTKDIKYFICMFPLEKDELVAAAKTWSDNSQFKANYIPYVAFMKNGEKVFEVNQPTDKNLHKNVNDGFKALEG